MANDVFEGQESGLASFRENLRRQAGLLSSCLTGVFGRKVLTPGDLSVNPAEGTNSALAEEALEERQRRLTQKILDSLRQKGVLAGKEESWREYQGDFHISAYSAPEIIMGLPGGKTRILENGEIKIFLNPHFTSFKADYQLLTALEEAIHWSQFRHGRSVTWEEEFEASQRILKMKDYLGLSPERIDYLNDVMEGRAKMMKEEETSGVNATS